MHEVSIIGQIFDLVQENIDNHNLKKVNKIVIKIGEFTCVQESALRFAFEAFSKDTKVEGAQFIINKVEASAKCDNCEESFKVSFTNKVCPKCNTFSNNIVTGYEMLLDEIEGE